MKTNMQILVLSGMLCALLTACGGDSKSDSSGAEQGARKILKTGKDLSEPQTKPTSQPTSSGKVVNEWVNAHNKYRKMHQVGNVKWSPEIAKKAQAWADTCPSGHSERNGKYRNGRGENMAWGSLGSFTGVVDNWYSKEEHKHDYKDNNPDYTIAGHFTQIVWKNTTEIGCGYSSKCKVYVCQYNPSGNYSNEYLKNVFPKK